MHFASELYATKKNGMPMYYCLLNATIGSHYLQHSTCRQRFHISSFILLHKLQPDNVSDNTDGKFKIYFGLAA